MVQKFVVSNFTFIQLKKKKKKNVLKTNCNAMMKTNKMRTTNHQTINFIVLTSHMQFSNEEDAIESVVWQWFDTVRHVFLTDLT